MQNQEYKDQKAFDPTGSLRVPKNIELRTSQPAVEMTAKKYAYLYESPPLKPKNDCIISSSKSKHKFQGAVYYYPELKDGQAPEKGSRDGVILTMKDDKIVAHFFESGKISELIVDLDLSKAKQAQLKALPEREINLKDHANSQLLQPIIEEALKKGKRWNSSRFFDDLGTLEHPISYIDDQGKARKVVKQINARYYFDKDTEVVATPMSSNSNIFEVRVIARISEEKNFTSRPEELGHVETVIQGYMFASDLKSTVQHFKPSISPLFSEKPHLGQTKQGSHANCFLLASIESILNKPGGPEFIMGMMKQDKEGVIVRLYEQGPDEKFRPVYIRVPNAVLYKNTKRSLFTKQVSEHLGGLWIHALENAYVILGQKLSGSEDFCPSFVSIYGQGGASYVAMQALTGQVAHYISTAVIFPKSEDSSDIFVKAYEFDEKEQNPGAHKELLNKYLSEDSLLRTLFHNNEDHIILLLKEIKKQMKNPDFSLFDIVEIFTEFDSKIISTQEDFEKAMEKFQDDFKKVFQQFDEPARNTLTSAIDITKPRDHEGYKFHYITGTKEFNEKYTYSEINIFQHISKSLQANLLLTASTKSTDVPEGLAAWHAYTIIGQKKIGDHYYITLRNPWGFYGLRYNKKMDKIQRSADLLKDVFDIELGDFTKFFASYEIGQLSMMPPLGLKMNMNPGLMYKLKVSQLEKISALLETGLETHGLGKAAFDEKSATEDLTNEQKLFINQEIDSYEPAFIHFVRQRLKSLDDIFSFKKYVELHQEKECKTPGFEDGQAFDDEISKLFDPETKGENSSTLKNYLQHIDTIDHPNIKSYVTSLLSLIGQIQQFQESFIGLTTATQLGAARQHAENYLSSLRAITNLINETGYYSNKMSSLVSSAALFGQGLQKEHQAQQTAMMQKNLDLLSPFMNFSAGNQLGDFVKEFKHISFEEAQVIGQEIQHILSLVNSPIRVAIFSSGDCPTIQLKGVNNVALGKLIKAQLRFDTDKIVNPHEYAVKPLTMTLGS